MKKKIKIYRMPLSRVFPATHPKAGQPTCFKERIICNQCGCKLIDECVECGNGLGAYELCKIHTIRSGKKGLWKHRIEEVQKGNAVLVIYQWNGKPYSKDGNTNLFVFGTSVVKEFINELLSTERYKDAIPVIDSGIGVQKLTFDKDRDGCHSLKFFDIDGHYSEPVTLANNDGLSLDDFRAWLRSCDLSKPMTIIHFTKFRY